MNAAQTLGNGATLYALGQEWTLSAIGPKVRAAFGAWCRAQAKQRLWDEKDEMTDEQYKAEKAALEDKIDAGHYSWGTPLEAVAVGDGIVAALSAPQGQLALLQVLLRAKHGDVPAETLLKIVGADLEAFAEAIRKVVSLDPNSAAPARTAALPGEKVWQKNNPPTTPTT